ncbi:MAG TPA: DNA alkylation repair protein [Patescibacteria group bacterium]|nr:DNA alkylation repair protein [Patescibacteria group bacterium]
MLNNLRTDIQKEADLKKAKFLGRFFKTGKGEYAEGDVFLGLTVPQSRVIVKKYRDLPLVDCLELLQSPIHEERLIALLIMVSSFAKASEDRRKKIYNAYLSNTKYINNWDLVDLSAANIIGGYLLEIASPSARSDVLVRLATSENLWEKRIAIIATFAFIRKGEYETTFKIADILLHDTHDLIHKAVGWMLREVGKRISEEALENYLKSRYKTMPRTSLRYAIERFEEGKRKKYLVGAI